MKSLVIAALVAVIILVIATLAMEFYLVNSMGNF